MTTAVVVVNWNSGARLLACIESLLATSPEVEIVVVDNASSDDSLEAALGFRDNVDFIRNSTNRGLAAAMNQGFAATATSYVLMLNPDVRATTGAVAQLEQIMDGRPRAGAVGGYVNEKYLPRDLPTPSALVRQNLGIATKLVRGNTEEDARPVEQPAAAALLIRRDAYDEIGGFDERFYPAWYEDVDFCSRLKSGGWEIYFSPQAEFMHEGGYSAKTLGVEAFAETYYRNQLRYAYKHFGRAAALSVRLSITAGMLGRIVVHPGKSRAHFRTILGALIQW